MTEALTTDKKILLAPAALDETGIENYLKPL